ncbi:MAG: aldo/keto reductase [Planctomycetes bacterium]|nr:aldo/keto reductase [Planctomycetota bacterium]
MHLRRLGNSDLMITPLGFGSWAIGGPGWPFAWGGQDDGDSSAAIHEALDLGFNWIDTAPVYGLGHSEEVVARALAGLPAGRRPLLFTKCGRVWNERREVGKRLTAASIRAECEASLRRLGVDCIDLYQIHWPEPDEEVEEGWAECARLVRDGKVRWIGVSNFNVAQLERATAIAPVTSLQPPYSLLRRDIQATILPWCSAHGVGVLAYSPMASGLLTGAWSHARFAALAADDWRKEKNPLFQEPRFSEHLAFVERLRPLAAARGISVGALALAWVLGHGAVTAAIVGARRPGQLAELVAAADVALASAERDAITALLPG